MNITTTELAARAGITAEEVTRLQALGILPPGDTIDERLVIRIRMARRLEESGISLDDVGAAIAAGDLTFDFVDRIFVRPGGLLETTFADHAAELSLSTEFVSALQLALGRDVDAAALATSNDLELMRSLAGFVGLGVDEGVLLRMFEVMADNLRRSARATSEMWDAGVSQPLLDSGLTPGQLLGARSADSPEFQRFGDNIMLGLWHRFMDEEMLRGITSNLEVRLAETGARPAPGARPPAIAFLDLTAFTHRTGEQGDEVAAAGARHLVDIVRRELVGTSGTLVKMLGDGAMLHFTEPDAAVRCALDLVRAVPEAGLPPARFGISAGPVIQRDVDYFGQTVNVAARLVDYARPGEVLVSDEAVAALSAAEIHFTEIGPVSLKGISELVTVYAATNP